MSNFSLICRVRCSVEKPRQVLYDAYLLTFLHFSSIFLHVSSTSHFQSTKYLGNMHLIMHINKDLEIFMSISWRNQEKKKVRVVLYFFLLFKTISDSTVNQKIFTFFFPAFLCDNLNRLHVQNSAILVYTFCTV